MAPRRLPTVIGTVGSAHDVLVHPHGAVAVAGARWSLDWWVGASDRWRHPIDEPATAVTQRRVDGVPVVETSLRVPGGQVVHRTWCLPGTGGEVAAVELENRSKEAVAVAAVVHGATRVDFDGERSVVIDGRALVVLGRRPARTAVGDEESIRRSLAAGEGEATGPFDARAPHAAFVFPLAHTARLRLAVPIGRSGPPVDPDGLADPERVLSGWRIHLEAGVRVALPDDALDAAIAAARTTALVRSDRPRPPRVSAAVATALDWWGHHDAAAIALDGVLATQRLNGSFGGRRDGGATAAVLTALGVHARATGDAAWAETVAGPVAKAAHRVGKGGVRRPEDVVAELDAADLLERAGQPEAAGLCRERVAALEPVAPLAPPSLVELHDAGAGAAGIDDVATGGFLHRARALLVDDTTPGVLRLCPAFPDDWLGRELEAHRLPTRSGSLSFAIRWHGPRPALLWELEGDRAATLHCPGLDPSWSSVDPVGEGLLGLVEPAGGLPKVVAPLASGTPADGVPPEGDSFR